MVYTLVSVVLRRNIKLSTLHHASIFKKRVPSFLAPHITFSSDVCEKKPSEKKGVPSASTEKVDKGKPNFSDGKSHVNYMIDQIMKGKISAADITTLAQRVIRDGQYQKYNTAPQTVQYIGFAGLVPMLGLPIMTLLSGHATAGVVFVHLAYGATILSFLGGSSWYNAIANNEVTYEKLGWAVVPQLVGWTSLLLPLPLGILWSSLGFCLSAVHDILLTNYPQWLKSLRLILTGGTLASFFLMLLFYMLL